MGLDGLSWYWGDNTGGGEWWKERIIRGIMSGERDGEREEG